MKRFMLVIVSLLVLVGCGTKITKEDLTKNDWQVESENDDPSMIVHFSDDKVSIKVNTDSIQSSATNEWEKYGEDYAKQIIDEFSYDFDYTIDKNEMIWKNDDGEAKYTMKKEDNDIVLVPDKSNRSDNSKDIILKPYKNTKKKTKENTSKTSSSASEVSSTTQSQSVIESSSTSEATVDYSINDFTGGWGVPNSGNLFFINSDETLSNSSGETIPLEKLTITPNSDGSLKLSFVMNGMKKELVKNSDGSVTTDDGVTYEYLGNMTLNEYLTQKNG